MDKLLKVSIGILFLALTTPQLLFGQNDVVYQSIRLFESGVDPVPLSERVYSTHFSTAETRYIYYEVYVDNNLYNIKNNPVFIHAKYYYPDGSLFADYDLNYTIPSDWDDAYLWKGWGWGEAGNWSPGTYRVEIYMNNKKITETLFSIYNKYWTSSIANK